VSFIALVEVYNHILADTMTSPSDSTSIQQAHKKGLIFPIAIIYIMLGAAIMAASFLKIEINSIRLSPWDAILPAFIVIAGVGAILRKPWGRWLSYLVSLPMLLGVPIGTLLGGYMIYQLTIHRAQFKNGLHDQNRVS
jgi:hypothetical protein